MTLQHHNILPKWNKNPYQINVIVALLPGPAHPPKVKFQVFCQNVPYYQPQEEPRNLLHQLWGPSPVPPRLTEHYQSPHPQELPGSKEHPIFHKPGSIKISSVEDLLKLYPNSLIDLALSRESMTSKVDPTVPPVQHVRRKVPIESKAAIKDAIDYMVKQDILEPQIEPTPWGIFSNLSSQTYRGK